MLLIFKTVLTLVFFNIWAFNPGQLKLDNEQIVQKAHVFGKDDRQPLDFNNKSVPWRALGKIFTSSGECTGILISSTRVLTSAHCIFDYKFMSEYEKKMKTDSALPVTGRYKINYSGFRFMAGYLNGKSYIESKVITVLYDEGITTLNSQSKMADYENDKDWSILTLENPVGITVGWFELEKINSYKLEKLNPRLMIAGYSPKYKNGKVPYVADDCAFKSGKGEIYAFKHDCDSTPGTSGGPIFMEKDGKLVVVAIHSGSSGTGSTGASGVKYEDKSLFNHAVTTGAFYKKLAELKN